MASVFAIASLTCISAADAAPSPADTLRLEEVQVTATPSALPRISSSGALNISRSAIDAAPRAFGEADPLRFLTLMPGVTAASDYSSGVSVDGMDYSQNLYRLNGIPVHFPYHFGGTMSVFSPAMYRRVTMYRTVKPASESGVLGEWYLYLIRKIQAIRPCRPNSVQVSSPPRLSSRSLLANG